MKKALLSLFILFLFLSADAQPGCPQITTNADFNLPCAQACTTLVSTAFDVGSSVSYTVGPIPYTPFSYNTGTAVLINTDDVFGDVISLPFGFCFFGQVYNSLVIGANGLITFDLTNANQYCDWNTAVNGPFTYANCIMGPYHDIDPSIISPGKSIEYQIIGTYPCRIFVVSWYNIMLYSNATCSGQPPQTQQIVLYETTNVIENYIATKTTCTNWNSGFATQGIHGSSNVIVPGRNNSTWNATNEGWRYTPTGPSIMTQDWLLNNSYVGSGPTLSICPTTYGLYTARATYARCDNAPPVVVTDNVFVGTLNLTVNIDSVRNPSCGLNNGTVYASYNTTSAVISYGFNPGSQGITTLPNVGPGTYIFNTQIAGCTRYDTATLVNTGSLSVVVNDSAFVSCNPPGSAGVLCANPIGGQPPYTYIWNNTQTGSCATGLVAGNYTVTATDAGGCTATDAGALTYTYISPSLGPPQIVPVSCFGGNNGKIIANPISLQPPINYSWTGGVVSNDTVSGLAVGSYSVTATDVNGCSASATYSVSQPTAISIGVPVITQSTCAVGGSITANASGGTAPLVFNWSNAQSGTSITNLAAGPYNITVTDQNLCTATATYNVTSPPGVITFGNPVIVNVSCNGGNNGTITVNASGGVAPISFAWSNGQSGATAINLIAGSYTVTATDANTCSASATYNITEPTPVVFGSPVIVSTNCGNGGSITVSASGGTGAISFLWSNATQGASITNVPAGPYTVTATDQNFCTVSATYNVPAGPGIIVISNPVTVNVNCFGGNNGSISITTSGGTAPLTAVWSNTQTGNSATGLIAGNYSVVVTDPTGCSATAAYTITQPTQLVIDSFQITNIGCAGGATGSIAVFVSGATPPYTYAWVQQSNSQNYSGASINNLSPDTYNLTVTDLNSCSVTASRQITQITPLTFSSSSTNVSCNGGNDGTATINVLTGTLPYNYDWNGTGASPNSVLNGISAGTVNVTITDANCSATATFTITEPTALVITPVSQTDVSCFGGNNGSVSTSTSGGTAPITSLWSNTQTGNSATGLIAGNYSVVATDQNGCTVTASYTVSEPTQLVIDSFLINHIGCSGAITGSLTVYVSGATPTYAYSWVQQSNSQSYSGASINNLSPDTYDLTVTDLNGCSVTDSRQITQVTPLTFTSSFTNISCNGGNDGTATITVLTGTPPYNYDWNGTGASTNAVLTGVSAGTVNVTITDANCSGTATFTLIEPTAIVITHVSQTEVSCFGGNDGSITVSVAGGTPAYDPVVWSNSQNGYTATGLSAGTFTVSVTDANLCPASQSYTITEPTALTTNAISVNATCYQAGDGSVDAAPSNGTPPYTFLWTVPQTTQIANSLNAGTYTCTLTDANGCTALATGVVNEPADLVINAQGFPVKCIGDRNGYITVSSSGGTQPYNFSATQDFANFVFATNGIIQGLAVGTYTVIVSDNNGCTKTTPATVPDATPDVFITTTDSTSCYGPDYDDGAAHITAVSIQNEPYQYSIDGGTLQPSGDFYNLSAGAHTVTAINVNGCSSQIPIVVFEPQPMEAQVIPDTLLLPLGQSGSVQVVYLNASNVSFSWTPFTGLSCSDCPNPNVLVYEAGDYVVTVSVQNGTSSCFATANLHVEVEPHKPVFIPNSFSPNGDGNNDIFEIYGEGIKFVEFTIFNRWGELVYKTNSQFSGWDGTFKGQLQLPQVFTYNARVTFLDDKKAEKHGSVTLLR